MMTKRIALLGAAIGIGFLVAGTPWGAAAQLGIRNVIIEAALPAGTNNIGDVDVASSTLPTGAATSANQSTAIGHVDGIEGLLTTIDADTGALAALNEGDDGSIAGAQNVQRTAALMHLWNGSAWVRGSASSACLNESAFQTFPIDTASAGNVQIVPLDGSDLIYVCGYSLVAGAATSVQFIYGTGTACATGETDITGAWSFAANGGITQSNAGASQFVVPAGNALCVENSGANAVQGHVTYVQQP